ncbi:MAG: FGGY-family carbohydrate kinase [Clostridia bacterium]
MKDEKLVLSYDLGTQSIRAIIFDKEGNTIAKDKIVYEEPYFSTEIGYAEQTPEFYWDAVCSVSKKLHLICGNDWEKITAVSVTTCRDVVTCLDGDNNPLRPFILYLDQRRVENIEERFNPIQVKIFKLLKMWDTVSSQFCASPCNWLSRHEPQIWAKTKKFVMLSGYMNYKLSGALVDSYASQVGHVPYNYKKKKWQTKSDMSEFLYDAKIDKMIELVEPCKVIGTISKEVSLQTDLPFGISVITSGADKACETIGVGCDKKDIAAISLGTSASVEIATDKYIEPLPFLPAYSSIYPNKYHPEILIYRGFWMISWFKKEFAEKEITQAENLGCSVEEILDREMTKIPIGCNGLVLQPYWSPCVQVPIAKGSMIGFSDYHTKMHIYRAIIEGVGFALYEGMQNMEKRTGCRIKKIAISGGGSHSDKVCQIMADLFGLPAFRVQTYETSALGAAMASFVGIKVYDNVALAVANMSHKSIEFLPNPENHKKYELIFNRVYKRVYSKNRKTFRNIREIHQDK